MEIPENTTATSQALRRITEARQVLQEVVTSSEQFDYRKAKAGLKKLQEMIRELGREEARLLADLPEGGAQVLPFPKESRDRATPA